MNSLRTNYLTIAVCITAISFFASCDKDDNGNAPDDGCLVSSFSIEWKDVCDGEINIQNNVFSFFYDDSNRLERLESEDGDMIFFSYHSDGRPQKIEDRWKDEVNTTYFTWEGNKVTRHLYYGDEPSSYKSVLELNSNDEIVRENRYYNATDDWELIGYHIYTYSNSNLEKIESFYKDISHKSEVIEKEHNERRNIFSRDSRAGWEATHPSGKIKTGSEFVHFTTQTFTHDNKLNPLGLHQALMLWQSADDPLFSSKNNVLTWSESEIIDGEEFVILTGAFQHQYNANDFPNTSVFEGSESNGCTFKESWDFSYMNCN